jgi:REP element-mobilizing transposase RayT
MPRGPRAISETGIYHVMLRGINQAQLFYDDEDRHAFIQRLTRYKDQCGFFVYAYCLMGNHIHLLIQENTVSLPVIMQKLTLSYSHWFNARYDRSGFLFSGRYKSEAIQTNEYLLAVLRYIHRNPVKIGEPITSWTSYNDYMASSSKLTDIDFALNILDFDPKKARIVFKELFASSIEDKLLFLDERDHKRPKDSEAIRIIKRVSELEHCGDIIDKDKGERDKILALLKKEGLSIRQISRLTGVNRGIVLKAGK